MINQADEISTEFIDSVSEIYLKGTYDCIKEVDNELYIEIMDKYKKAHELGIFYCVEKRDCYFYDFRTCLRELYVLINKAVKIVKGCINKSKFLLESDLLTLSRNKDVFEVMPKDVMSDEEYYNAWDNLSDSIKININTRVYSVTDMGSDEAYVWKKCLLKLILNGGSDGEQSEENNNES